MTLLSHSPRTPAERLAVSGGGRQAGRLDTVEIRKFVREGLQRLDVGGRRVLVIIPDGTRTMPMSLLFDLLEESLGARASVLDFLVALGTHPAMSDEQLSLLLGRPVQDGRTGVHRIFNHRWDLPETCVTLGTISGPEMCALTSGRLDSPVAVSINRLVLDQLLICGPVFPHEVVGFSGGTKYLVPGIAGDEIINVTHWLGALISSFHVIGAGYTPVRAVIDRAAAFVPTPVACLALVVAPDGIAGVYAGSPHDAWRAAAALSARVHCVELDQPMRRVLSVMPPMYDDLWTAAKGMYKMEPAVADGGEIVIYAPHITEVSYTHGRLIDEVGYHCRDYFLSQWPRFRHYPWGVLAHSTHVKGLGTYDPVTGVESPRIRVTLATGIPAARCAVINLGYLDPAGVIPEAWANREADGILVVPRAGEMLYRLKGDSADDTLNGVPQQRLSST
jgi:nickel-dependent lactate racemase